MTEPNTYLTQRVKLSTILIEHIWTYSFIYVLSTFLDLSPINQTVRCLCIYYSKILKTEIRIISFTLNPFVVISQKRFSIDIRSYYRPNYCGHNQSEATKEVLDGDKCLLI